MDKTKTAAHYAAMAREAEKLVIRVGRPDHLSGEEVYAQIGARYGVQEIDDAAAVTIASYWQAPRGVGYAMAQLASTGTVDYEELAEDIRETRKEAVRMVATGLAHETDIKALDMLGTWALRKIIDEE